VQDCVGEAVFSTAFQCVDTHTGMHVCMKVIKNDKEYFDQSLDEIKVWLLELVSSLFFFPEILTLYIA
jgi:hypothetical protein